MIYTKNILFLFVMVFATSIYSTEKIDATTLMQQVDERNRGNSWRMTSNVVSIDKKGVASQRKVQTTGKMYGRDEKTVTFVLEPSRLRGTGFMSYDWADISKENESWLFLPDLGKVTRLNTANRADYFLGTDFTYGDLEGLEVENFKYQYIENLKEDETSIVLVAFPKSDKIIGKYGYRKIQYWIDNTKKVIVQAKYWLKENASIKYYRQFDFKQHENVWLADREQMILTQLDKKINTTVITPEIILINLEVDDGLFTTYGLERGPK